MQPDQPQTQSRIFSVRWLPRLFHHTPELFINFLNHDGNKFLRFYWDLAGKDLPPDLCRDSYGLDFTFRQPASNVLITLVTLPKPQSDGESYFIALVYRPYRHLFLTSDTTKVITLELGESVEPGTPTTSLVEIIPRVFYREVLHSDPVKPELEDFYSAVLKQLV